MPWTVDTKDWDYTRPIHRVGSPFYLPSEPQPDGHGYSCGCRRETGIVGGTILPLDRLIPSWTAVDPIEEESFRELEGHLTESHQSRTDAPMWNWHHWYDWNFHVQPASGYQYIQGRGPQANVECEWDTGALTDPMQTPGPMFQEDWGWPMAGQYVWLAGRWIYDCGHVENGLMRTELHPCMAVASARWEAVRFGPGTRIVWDSRGTSNPNLSSAEPAHVPAIQFHFFASRRGGYMDFERLSRPPGNYRFLVDLPPCPATAGSLTMCRRDNSLAANPLQLFADIDYGPFTSVGAASCTTRVHPRIEIVPPPSSRSSPNQVLVTIPLEHEPNIDAFGVRISLGWRDSSSREAPRVRRCIVTLHEIRTGRSLRPGIGDMDWLFYVGVNGRWFQRRLQSVQSRSRYPLNHSFEFYLAEGDTISLTSGGAALNYLGRMLDRPEGERTVVNQHTGHPYRWDQIESAGQGNHPSVNEIWRAIAELQAGRALGTVAGHMWDSLVSNLEMPGVERPDQVSWTDLENLGLDSLDPHLRPSSQDFWRVQDDPFRNSAARMCSDDRALSTRDYTLRYTVGLAPQ